MRGASLCATAGTAFAIRLPRTLSCWTWKAAQRRRELRPTYPWAARSSARAGRHSKARIRITLTRKDQRVEALGVVRIVKPRIGMGIEFIDVESPYHEVLRRWVELLSKTR